MPVDDYIDERIQDAVEQKVEERLEEERDRIKEEVRDELLREDAESSLKKEGEGIDEGQSYSRRSFLKVLGVAGAGLGLAASGAAKLNIRDNTDFFGNIDTNGNKITDSTGQPVNINADTVDGKDASQIGGNNADTVDGYDIQKNGNNTNGVINFNTTRKTISIDGTIVSGERPIEEGFEDGSIAALESGDWTVQYATIGSDRSFAGAFSFGSFGGGSVDARWNVLSDDPRQISQFEYYWIEGIAQSGHEVHIYDSNGDLVQSSGTGNPQWFLNDASGGETRKSENGNGTNYNVWTHFKFTFNWSAGNYDYRLTKTDGSYSATGTQPLVRSTDVSYIDFIGGKRSGDRCRFDQLRILT